MDGTARQKNIGKESDEISGYNIFSRKDMAKENVSHLYDAYLWLQFMSNNDLLKQRNRSM